MGYALSILIFLPLVAALTALFMPLTKPGVFRILNLGVTLLQLIVLSLILTRFHGSAGFQLTEYRPWFTLDLGTLGLLRATYALGVDGLSMPLVALAVIIMIVVALSSWKVEKSPKGYFALLLTLNGAIIGTFCAVDFLLFYLFFEFMLLPMYFLIGLWGGPRREYASIKFLLYTLTGSLLILIVMIGLFLSVKSPDSINNIVHTLSFLDLSDSSNFIPGSIFSDASAQKWGFALLLTGFLIKLPSVPLHTWLPDAHVEAPTAISVILAALLLKIGGYGILRIAYPIFPGAALSMSTFVACVAVLSIIYGGLNALASKDLKRMIAYSSVSHMGFVLLGIAALTTLSVTGAVYEMVSHGLISAVLFLVAGVLYDRTHDRTINNYSGLSSKMPAYFTIVLISFFASMGLPGFSGFIAEVMVLFGSFQSAGSNGLLGEAFAFIAIGGLILSAAYFLWTLQRMFFGAFHYSGGSESSFEDLSTREYLMVIPLVIFILLLGLTPQPLLNFINPFADSFVHHLITTISGRGN